jgi:phosphomannomutase
MLIRSISGVRGLVKTDLLPETCAAYAAAVHTMVPDGVIMIGRDTRPSGEHLSDAMVEILLSYGRDVISLGIVPTPTVQFMVERTDAVAGVVITASHNPIQWNGLKFIRGDGTFFRPDECDSLFSSVDEGIEMPNHDIEHGKIFMDVNAIQKHIIQVVSIRSVNINIIRKKNFKVVIDAVNGAGYDAVPRLLESFNCEVIRINCEANGEFTRGTEPLPENLEMLSAAVVRNNADVGFAVDPDADRLALVSEDGKPLSDEYTLAIAGDGYIRKKNTQETFVINLSTSMVLEKIAARYNCSVERTPVGEINVVQKMIDVGANFGGEGNGGIILKEAHLGRDSLVGCAMVLNRMALTDERLSLIYAGLPQFVIVKDKIDIDGVDMDNLITAAIDKFEGAEINTEDGTKFTWDNQWIHLRKSNTEPIIRIYAEAENKNAAQKLIDKMKSLIET